MGWFQSNFFFKGWFQSILIFMGWFQIIDEITTAFRVICSGRSTSDDDDDDDDDFQKTANPELCSMSYDPAPSSMAIDLVLML